MNIPGLRPASKFTFGTFSLNLIRVSTGGVEFDGVEDLIYSCESDRIRVYRGVYNGEEVLVVQHAKDTDVNEEYSSTNSFERISKKLSKFLNFSKLVCIGRVEEKSKDRAYAYFVMEAGGKPLDSFLEEEHITVQQRNHLVEQICKATDYAIEVGCVSENIVCADILVRDNELKEGAAAALRYDAIMGGVHKYKVFEEN